MQAFWKQKKYLEAIFLALILAGFLIYKLEFLTFRFGDGNAYLYMAEGLLQGQLPYRDFFLADPPFLVLFLAPFKLIFGQKLILFQVLPIFLESLTAIAIYFILKKWRQPLAFFGPVFYLFSFTVLATSDYLTGIQLTVLLMTLGLLFWEYDFPLLSGLGFSLAILTKMYALPAFAGFLLYLLITKTPVKKFFRILAGALIAGIVILGPFLVLSFGKVYGYMFSHQLHRPPGLDKWYIWQFFLKKEWLLVLFGILGVMILKKKILILPLIFTAAFFLIFPDLYYLYLESFFAYLVLGAVIFLSAVWDYKYFGKQIALGVLAVYLLFASVSFWVYKNEFYTIGRFTNAPEVAEAVKKLPDKMELYGSHEVAPLIALMSGRNLFNNYIDTNTQAFASGGQDLGEASASAVRHGVYLLGRVTDLPQFGIKDFGMDGYFSPGLLQRYCQAAAKLPSTSGEQDNFIGIYRCKSD